jgi:hypothetical protein
MFSHLALYFEPGEAFLHRSCYAVKVLDRQQLGTEVVERQ